MWGKGVPMVNELLKDDNYIEITLHTETMLCTCIRGQDSPPSRIVMHDGTTLEGSSYWHIPSSHYTWYTFLYQIQVGWYLYRVQKFNSIIYQFPL